MGKREGAIILVGQRGSGNYRNPFFHRTWSTSGLIEGVIVYIQKGTFSHVNMHHSNGGKSVRRNVISQAAAFNQTTRLVLGS